MIPNPKTNFHEMFTMYMINNDYILTTSDIDYIFDVDDFSGILDQIEAISLGFAEPITII